MIRIPAAKPRLYTHIGTATNYLSHKKTTRTKLWGLLLEVHVLTLCSSLSAKEELWCSAMSRPRLLPSIMLGIKDPPNGSEKLRIICRIWSLWARNGSLRQKRRNSRQCVSPHSLRRTANYSQVSWREKKKWLKTSVHHILGSHT